MMFCGLGGGFYYYKQFVQKIILIGRSFRNSILDQIYLFLYLLFNFSIIYFLKYLIYVRDLMFVFKRCLFLVFGYFFRYLYFVYGLQSVFYKFSGVEYQGSKRGGEGIGSRIMQVIERIQYRRLVICLVVYLCSIYCVEIQW